MIERTADELCNLLTRGEISSETLTGAFLQAIRQRDSRVRAFLHVDEQGALERREPWGVWGGELLLRGIVVPRKRPRGRPRKVAAEELTGAAKTDEQAA